MNNKKSYDYIIVAAILLIGIILNNLFLKELYDDKEEKIIDCYESIIEKKDAYIDILSTIPMSSNPDFYYAEAQIIDQVKIQDNLIAITWQVNYSDVQAFISYSNKLLEDNVYLLTMYSNKTQTILDDEICVVWGQ